jgi:hypothetical protein
VPEREGESPGIEVVSRPTPRTFETERRAEQADVTTRPACPSRSAEQAPPTDAQLEAAIVQAVTLGAVDVARTLAERLQARRRPAAVVNLSAERHRRVR